jgi:hypothetical protein
MGGNIIYINNKILKQVNIPVHIGDCKIASHLQKLGKALTFMQKD